MNHERKLIPFGEIPESFRGVKDEGVYYVDKTGFIPYLIEQRRRICVFTRPRRFGKTLMLRTLQTFFEYRLDDEGKPVDNRRYFEGLKVMDAGENVLKHLGQYPVIYITLKDVKGDTFEDYEAGLANAVKWACRDQRGLLNSPKLSPVDRTLFDKYLSLSATKASVWDALLSLCAWLADVTGRKPVILLDEYDVPLQNAAIKGMRDGNFKLYDQVVELLGKFMSAGFKTNSNLAYGIISGCTRVAKESIFTGMNNPGVITVMSRIPEEFFGFTEDEVREMLRYYGIDDQYELISHWYDGYEYSGRHVYNPWSLLNAVRGLVNGYGEEAIQSYWVKTSGNSIIYEIMAHQPQNREMLSQILSGEKIWVSLYENISYRDLSLNPDSIWSFLLYTGYLKVVEKRTNEYDERVYRVDIPNQEIRSVMRSAARHWWQDIYVRGYNARPLMDALSTGNAKQAEKEINIALSRGISCFDYKEAFYHGTLYGLLQTQTSDIKSKTEFGNGRPDIVALWKTQAIVIECKRVSSADVDAMKRQINDENADLCDIEDACLEQKLHEGEKQIKDRRYLRGVEQAFPAADEIVCYTVAFCGKRCMVRKLG
ncbi:MAG: AAA family ATPase [Proteobacteria bacterium]|nr:AAA family ATPase [Pseudomonadota bacterium]